MSALRNTLDKMKPTFSKGGKLSALGSFFDAMETFFFVPKTVTARGYYRRSPVPYVQLKELVIDGEVKKCHSITWGWIWRWVLFGLAAVFTLLMIFVA